MKIKQQYKYKCLWAVVECCLPHYLAGRTLFSKCPWLVIFPAGEYRATTKEEPSDAVAFPMPISLVLFHTMAVKWPETRGVKG